MVGQDGQDIYCHPTQQVGGNNPTGRHAAQGDQQALPGEPGKVRVEYELPGARFYQE